MVCLKISSGFLQSLAICEQPFQDFVRVCNSIRIIFPWLLSVHEVAYSPPPPPPLPPQPPLPLFSCCIEWVLAFSGCLCIWTSFQIHIVDDWKERGLGKGSCGPCLLPAGEWSVFKWSNTGNDLTISAPSLRVGCLLPGPVLHESPRRWCHFCLEKLWSSLINAIKLHARQRRVFVLHCLQTVCQNIQIQWKKQALYLDSLWLREHSYLVDIWCLRGTRFLMPGVDWITGNLGRIA